MKTISYIWTVLALGIFQSTCIGQILSGDANGKSSVLVNGGNIAFDIQKESISFDYAQFKNLYYKDMDRKLVWGGSFKGKPDNGVAELIGSGNVAISGSMNLFVGFSSNYRQSINDIVKPKANRNISILNNKASNLLKEYTEKELEASQKKLETARTTNGAIRFFYLEKWRDTLNKKADDFIKKPIVSKLLKDSLASIGRLEVKSGFSAKFGVDFSGDQDLLVKKLLENEIKKKFQDSIRNGVEFEKAIPKLISLVDSYRMERDDLSNRRRLLPSIKRDSIAILTEQARYYDTMFEIARELFKTLHKEHQKLYNEILPLDAAYQKAEDTLKMVREKLDMLRDYWRTRGTWFLRLGAGGNTFKSFIGLDTNNVKDGLPKKYFSGLSGEIGYNYHCGGNYILAGSVGMQQVNNFSELSEQEIAITQEGKDKLGQKITIVQKLKGYQGNYQTYDQVSLNFDFVKFLPIKDTKNQYNTVLNFWIRHKIPTNQLIANTSTDVGISGFFFKNNGILMGGLYGGINDITDSQRKILGNDPKQLSNRFIFGLTARANFVRLLSY